MVSAQANGSLTYFKQKQKLFRSMKHVYLKEENVLWL